MKAATVTRERLDQSKCGNPECQHDDCILYVHPRCHPHGGIQARYEKGSGELVILCDRCRSEVVRMVVA